jgi:hypothetical protein
MKQDLRLNPRFSLVIALSSGARTCKTRSQSTQTSARLNTRKEGRRLSVGSACGAYNFDSCRRLLFLGHQSEGSPDLAIPPPPLAAPVTSRNSSA